MNEYQNRILSDYGSSVVNYYTCRLKKEMVEIENSRERLKSMKCKRKNEENVLHEKILFFEKQIKQVEREIDKHQKEYEKATT